MEGERYEENKEARHDSLDTQQSFYFYVFVIFCWRDFEGFLTSTKKTEKGKEEDEKGNWEGDRWAQKHIDAIYPFIEINCVIF